MAGEIRVGTSGWQYDDWRGRVYPEGMGTGRWLSHYATLFPTVEVNATFYRLARESTVRGWRDAVPEGFEFALKGSRFITHQKKLREPEEALGRFFAPLAPLGDAGAVVLWQLPPNLRRDPGRLDAFLAALRRGPRYAVEFRDDDWFHPETYAVLERHGVATVWLSSSLTGSHHEHVRTGAHVYVRFHGLGDDPARYHYRDEELASWADRLREVAREGTPAWVYFNNDTGGYAARNARRLRWLLGDAARPPAAERDPRTDPRPPNAGPAIPREELTDFQRAVVGIVEGLGPGEVLTYGEVALEARRPGAAQAVANVLRRVPRLPWWRVVPSEGRIYATHAGTQIPLLLADGVDVDDHRRVRP